MIKYILKRIVQVIPVLLGVSIIVFLMLSLSPGDPARLALGMNAKPEQIEAFNHENGLDQPVLVQYVNYMKGLVTGNLGVSYTTKQSVAKMIAVRLPATCILAFGSLVLTYLIAIPLGILLAVKQNTFFDDAFRVVALIVSSIPAFWLGLLLMLLFSVKLGILPSNGFDTPLHWILPLLCSCFGTWAGSSRYIRAMVLDTIRQDYVRTARAKGTPERQVLFRHAFKNALLPLITSIGFSIGNFFGGSIVIEQVFGINGMGRMMLSALREKDIPTVMAGVIITAIMIALGNLVADLLYGVVDPRIRAVYTSGGKKRSLWTDAWRRMRRSHTAVIGMILFALIVIVCFSAPLFSDYDAQVINSDIALIRKYPVEGHPLGTDELGRDLLLRILWGGRTSITIALAATVVSSVLGIILGAIPAYYGGATDSIIMRTLDVFMAIPSMLLMITLVNIMKPTTFNLIIAMSISGVPSIARIVRGQMLSVMRNEYVEAVRGMGASGVRIVVKHVLPNAISPLIAQIVSSVAGEITMISTLSYIGLGVQQPAPEWGSMLAAGQQFIRDQPYLTIFPGLAIVITIISLTLMGDGLRDALDPRMKR